MMTLPDAARRRELGEFIRARRERLTPAAFGIELGPRRRTPGLRREEIAQICGLSATWYTWIEQGRDVSISAAALSRLGKTLRLSQAERTYLFDLAGKRDPDVGSGHDKTEVSPALIASVAAMSGPAYLLDGRWNAVAWNDAAARLFIGWLDAAHDRNLLRYIFLQPASRALIPDWPDRARRVLAEFRADHTHHLDDPRWRAEIDDLSQRSASFAQAWEAHAVTGREGGARTFTHPQDGFLRYEQVTFTLASHPEIKLVLLAPVV